ncbi:hybrid sensor histidine kinase/response regulator [Rhodopseudomonas sp. WA056]|uniref:Response regulator receiver protein n=1 Tax=Rhodopseudomonas palustris (strain DX-1) TaxID=652103 RepID=E6VIU2_RHOPX|nr:hybrid sensor histidine kinase/response regulator [Rhodopseudomonas sp. WA056]
MKSRVLHIDDDPAMLKVVAAVLSRDPTLETRGCLSAEEGMRAAAEWLPDLILSDVSMPEVDGLQLLGELRNRPLTMGIPVVFTTACGRFEDIADFKALGASGIIAKPFNLRELIGSVRGYLALAASAVDDAGPAPEIGIRDRFKDDAALLRELRGPFEAGGAPDDLRHVVHKLVGVAGIYGFGAISDAAAAVEDGIAHMTPDGVARADTLAGLDGLLELLDRNSGPRPD